LLDFARLRGSIINGENHRIEVENHQLRGRIIELKEGIVELRVTIIELRRRMGKRIIEGEIEGIIGSRRNRGIEGENYRIEDHNHRIEGRSNHRIEGDQSSHTRPIWLWIVGWLTVCGESCDVR
jgi:hypothetical protein